jgi:hypothetical protein
VRSTSFKGAGPEEGWAERVTDRVAAATVFGLARKSKAGRSNEITVPKTKIFDKKLFFVIFCFL